MTDEEDKIEVKFTFKVKIEDKVLKKMEVITSDYQNELAGFLFGSVSDGEIVIKDIVFPPQEVSPTSVDIEDKDVLKLRRNNPNWKNLLGMWHSHGNMTSFWSGGDGDESHIKFLSSDKDITVFIVSSHNNSSYHHKTRVEISKPFKMSFDNIPLEVTSSDAYKFQILKSIKKIIRKPKKESIKIEEVTEIKYIYDKNLSKLSITGLNYEEVSAIKDKYNTEYRTCILEEGKWTIEFDCESKKEGNQLKSKIEILLNAATYPNLNIGNSFGYDYRD